MILNIYKTCDIKHIGEGIEETVCCVRIREHGTGILMSMIYIWVEPTGGQKWVFSAQFHILRTFWINTTTTPTVPCIYYKYTKFYLDSALSLVVFQSKTLSRFMALYHIFQTICKCETRYAIYGNVLNVSYKWLFIQ